jgi:predicted RNA-binding Zn ribbon-like protein
MEKTALAPGPAEGLCLDFANTRYWRGSPEPTEDLQSPADLLGWFERAQVLDPASLCRLQADWAATPAAAKTGFNQALALREAIFAVFAAMAGAAQPPAEPLATLNAALTTAPERHRLRHAPEGWRWEIPAAPLAPVLWSAGDLLTGARLGRVRQCANPRCLWLFLDDSKGANRRWCSMASCGNRAKAHRHYLKRKAEAQGSPKGSQGES